MGVKKVGRKKFASLVPLSIFTAGVTASSAVSASRNVDDVPVQINPQPILLGWKES